MTTEIRISRCRGFRGFGLGCFAYTIKMSKMGDHRIDGYFDFVVPPLEGFWWQPGVAGVDCADKAAFRWISAIRLPDFVTPEEFA